MACGSSFFTDHFTFKIPLSSDFPDASFPDFYKYIFIFRKYFLFLY